MLKIVVGNKPKCTGLEQVNGKMVAKATFTGYDKPVAVSLNPEKGFFKTDSNGDLLPNFLTDSDELDITSYEIRTVGSDLWIQKKGNNKSIFG